MFSAFDEKYMYERHSEVEVQENGRAVVVEIKLYEIKDHAGNPICVGAAAGRSFPEFVVAMASGGKLIGKDADLRGIDLGGCDLRNANLSYCKMFGAFLVGADLRGANLQGSDIENAYTTNAIL